MYSKFLRECLKEAQVRCRKLGYRLTTFRDDTLYLKRLNINEDIPESYIKLSVKYIRLDDTMYTLEFLAEPCKIPGGTSTMPINVANRVCDYWKKALKDCMFLNSLHIRGTAEDLRECIEDIEKRSRV